MTVYTSYEVRVFRNNEWRIEAVLDDEALAIAAARKIESRLTSTPIVVVQEVYDAARNHHKSQSVYRSEPAVRPAASAGKRVRASVQKSRGIVNDPTPNPVRSVRTVESAPASSLASWALFGVLVAALSAYAALRTLSGS